MNLRRVLTPLLVLITGCGGASDVDVQQEQATRNAEAWLAVDGNSAVLVRWTEEDANQVSGVLQLAELEEFEVEGQTWSMTGVIGDGQITLTVEGLFGSTSTLTGDYSDSALTLYWPEEIGSLNAVIFERSTIAEYNQAVEALRASGAEQAAWQEQAEYEANAIAEADSRVASARRSLESAISGFDDGRDWAGYSVDSVEFALESLHDAVLQLEDTLESDPEFAESDLDWAEDSYQYLQDEVDYALGPEALGVIDGAIADLNSSILDLESAIDDLREVEELYLSSEFAPYDASAERTLIQQARTIIDTTGPAAISELRRRFQEMLDEGTELIGYARSLVG